MPWNGNVGDLVLYDFQRDLVQDIDDAWQRTRSVIAWLPTGGGKTEVAVYLAKREAENRGCTLFIVERKTLAGQTRNRYNGYRMLTGLLRGEDTFVRGYEPVIVATVQTLKARWDQDEVQAVLDRVTLVVIDEAHIKFKHHDEILSHLPNARVLGLTATPLRDGLGLMYGELVRGPTYPELIDKKRLVPCRYFAPHLEDIKQALRGVDVSSTGDFVSAQLSALMRQRTIIGDVVETWREKAGQRSTICFCVDIAHSKALCDAFNEAGVPAEHIDLHTDEDDREAMFQRFRRGETRVLCSIVVLAVGFDESAASCAVLARPTLSRSLYIQQVGRVMRQHDGKSDALVLDHACNTLRFGKVEEFVPPPLSEIDKRTDKVTKKHESDYFPCPECKSILSPGQRVCGECGHEIARRSNVDSAPGELTEDNEPPGEPDYQQLYRELIGVAEMRGYKRGWAYFKMKEHRGFNAPRHWMRLPAAIPSQGTLNLVKSWQIAYAKRKQRERVA